MKYYYVNSQGKSEGPATLEQIQELVRTGLLNGDPMVIAEGGTNWKALSALRREESKSTAAEPSPTAHSSPSDTNAGNAQLPFSRTVLGDFVVKVLNRITVWLNEEFVTRCINVCRNAGQLAILLGGILGVVYCIVIAIRTNQLIPALVAVGFVVALAIGQFVAVRFLEANETLIANTPHRLSSKAFFECTGLIALLISLGFLAMGVVMAIQVGGQGGISVLVPAVMTSILFVFRSAIAFNPRIINIAPGGGSSGEEAVGILGFFLKTELKLLPVSFLVVGVTADFDIIRSFASNASPLDIMGSGELNSVSAILGGYFGLALLLVACLLPLLGYMFFLIFNLALEIARAILSLTGK